jgi:preprotein translocase subunit YajC
VSGILFAELLAATTKKSSSSPEVYLVLIVIAVGGYFLLVRPQQRRAKAQRSQQSTIVVGDEVVTIGGIKGRVVAIDDQHVTIVTGEDVHGFAAKDSQPNRITLVRNAINRKIEPVVEMPDDDEDDDEENDASYDDDYNNGYDDDDYPGDGQVAEGGGAGS